MSEIINKSGVMMAELELELEHEQNSLGRTHQKFFLFFRFVFSLLISKKVIASFCLTCLTLTLTSNNPS